jgi:hypothetical protein
MRGITRREFGALGAPTALAVYAYLRQGDARAQESGTDVSQLLRADRTYLRATNDRLRDPSYMLKYMFQVEQNYVDQRRVEAKALRAAALRAETFEVFMQTSHQESWLDPDTGNLAVLMWENGIDPAPDPAQITPLERVPLPMLRPEPKIDVIIDIILEATGLLDVSELCKEMFHEISGLNDRVRVAAEMTKEPNGDKIIDAIRNVVRFFFDHEGMPLVLAWLGRKGVAAIFLRQLALRLVPFVG